MDSLGDSCVSSDSSFGKNNHFFLEKPVFRVVSKSIVYHEEDLDSAFLPDLSSVTSVALDTEAMGLNNIRDRLCLVQLCFGDGIAHLIKISRSSLPNASLLTSKEVGVNRAKADRAQVNQTNECAADHSYVSGASKPFTSPNLVSILSNSKIEKIFHFARFDVAILQYFYGLEIENIFCTKIASRLVRTYSNYHGLKELCSEILSIKLSKMEQSSDWGADNLTVTQMEYAAKDVLYLHDLRDVLYKRLLREGRSEFARDCFAYIPTRAKLDLLGWGDILAH